MAITLKDIAEKSGVSTSTVSRVLNSETQDMVNDKTAKTVIYWAKKLGYPAYIEKNNIDGKNIGCILSEVTSKFDHPYFSSIIKKIEAEIKKRGHKLAFLEVEEDIKNENSIDKILNQNLDGVISISDHLSYEIYKKINNKTENIVFIGNRFQRYKKDTVSVNREEAAYKAVRYLIKQGHKKIGFIGGGIFPVPMEKTKRYQGFLRAMNESELAINTNGVGKGNWKVESGYELMEEILEKSDITAAFICSDQMAIGALRLLHNKNIKVPEEFSIISYDNVKMSKFTNPPLTTINVPKEDLALMAINALLMRIDGKMNLPCNILLPTELIKRESVSKLND
jgi:DNA-binding LacI/PurR family transcriptional regulator